MDLFLKVHSLTKKSINTIEDRLWGMTWENDGGEASKEKEKAGETYTRTQKNTSHNGYFIIHFLLVRLRFGYSFGMEKEQWRLYST